MNKHSAKLNKILTEMSAREKPKYNSDLINTAYEESLRNKDAKRSGKKYFVIKYGPPASGKASIQKELAKINPDFTAPYIEVDVDQYVKGLLNNPAQPDYWILRCSADQISDGVLLKAVSDNVNIFWETTGESLDWTLGV